MDISLNTIIRGLIIAQSVWSQKQIVLIIEILPKGVVLETNYLIAVNIITIKKLFLQILLAI